MIDRSSRAHICYHLSTAVCRFATSKAVKLLCSSCCVFFTLPDIQGMDMQQTPGTQTHLLDA